MSDSTYPFFGSRSRRTPSAARVLALVGLAGLLYVAPYTGRVPADWTQGMIVVGVSVLFATLWILIGGLFADKAAHQTLDVLAAFVDHDDCASVIADEEGTVLVANPIARQQLKAGPEATLPEALRSVFANPSSLLLRLQTLAQANGSADEDIITVGENIPVSVVRLGDHMFCWRFKLGRQGQWDKIALPVLTIGRGGRLLNLNTAARAFFSTVPGSIDNIFPNGLPHDGQICSVPAFEGERRVAVTGVSASGAERHLVLMPVSQPVQPEHGSSLAELPVPIICMTPEGIILEANQMARGLLGDLRLNETNIDQILQGLSHPILEWLAQTASGENAARSEFQRLTRDDKELFVQVTLDRVQIDGKTHLIAVLNDATELKTLEAQFVQGQKMQAVGQLAGGVAHDFNNLLTAISGHCDLLLLRHDQNDPNYGDLVQINQNANRAAALVSQLLAFSRKQTLRPEVLDVRDTISDLIHLLNRLVGEKVQLTLSHDPVLKPVRADKRQLEQVLMNLVVNARDAMPEGGEIRIETEVLSLTEPLRRDRATVPPGDYMTVKVIDSGVGIPADKLQKVFEPFYTTKRTGEGTGLGLSTVYGIVKQTGGFIFVDSAVSRGTEFSLLLPVCVEAKPVEVQPEDVPDSKTARQGEGVVLLVEDEAPVRAFATRALRLKGYTVLEAESAEDALTLLEDSDLNVDVFVTDVVMPGMDGPTWVAKAMETRPDVRVVFVSGYTEGAFGDSGPQVPNSTFLPKPFSLTQLTEAVFQQMN